MTQVAIDQSRYTYAMRRWSAGAGTLAAIGTMLLAVSGRPAQALTIDATFDTSITGSADASVIKNAIDSALGFYHNFSDPVTVSIDYRLANLGSNGLGASQSAFYLGSYATFTNGLAADASVYGNSVEATGYNHLGTGNTAAQIIATSANYRALGFSAPGTLTSTGLSGGTFDGVVYLSSTNLAGFGGAGIYPALQTIQHETDEVLGIGGSGSVLNIMQQNGLTAPPSDSNGSYIGALDLFRYSAPGTPSLTTSGSALSYFSINGGVTNLVAFNQNSGGDYADWAAPGCTALVQRAFSCASPGASLGFASPEVTALQAVGYDLPEPAGLAVFGASLFGLVVTRRSRRTV